MIKDYADSRFGQVHLRRCDPTSESTALPLVCLHPAPYSGAYFESVMPKLAASRTVIAPDYPGYGGSEMGTAPQLSIADYATAMLDALESAGIDGPVDVLGFHTGCLVAMEMAHTAAARCRRLVLCDIPYFTKDEQDALRAKVTKPLPLAPHLECLESAWKFNVTVRLDDMPLERAFALFVEQLRSATGDWHAFDAAFRYDCESRCAALDADVVCLATQSALHAPTLAAAERIPFAHLVDVTEVTSAVFEAGADAIGKRILTALDSA